MSPRLVPTISFPRGHNAAAWVHKDSALQAAKAGVCLRPGNCSWALGANGDQANLTLATLAQRNGCEHGVAMGLPIRNESQQDLAHAQA